MTSCVSRRWATDPEYVDLLNYIIERTKNVESPLIINRLTEELKIKIGTSQTLTRLKSRIDGLRSNIHNLKQVDTNTKVKMMFALSASVDTDFLEELKKNALVEVDEKNRIINYKSNDGSLELKGDHSQSAKNQIKHYKSIDSSLELNGDRSKSATQRTAQLASKRNLRSLIDSYLEEKNDSDAAPESKKEKEMKDRCREILRTGFDTFRGSIQGDLNKINEDKDIQQIPKPLQAHDEHNQIEEVSIKIEVEEPVETKPEKSHNSKIKFFEAMQSLILFLDTPSLSWIQSKIHQKIQKLGGPDEVILNNEIVQIVDLLIARIIDLSEVNLSESVESVNLSNFLCYLNASILNSKLIGVEGLVMNISELIEKLQNKRIPMEKVANALRATLDIDSF